MLHTVEWVRFFACVMNGTHHRLLLSSIPTNQTATSLERTTAHAFTPIAVMLASRLVLARRTLVAPRWSRGLVSWTPRSSSHSVSNAATWMMTAAAATTLLATATVSSLLPSPNSPVQLEKQQPSSDVISIGTPTQEPATGILFPKLCNGFTLAGVGHRVKYVFVKVYAVATYLDPIAMSAVRSDPAALEKALLDPSYPRTMRIVMARGLSAAKFTAGIVESLEPRMKGMDLDKLQEFQQLNPSVDMEQGAVIEMTIRGDTVMYKNALGTVGSIRSRVFAEALCDTYFGAEAVSPTLKASVLEGTPKL